MNKTAIGWTDYSANPLKYRDAEGHVRWACAKVSAGCANCYSEALAKRWNRGSDYNAGEVAKLQPFLDEKELRAMRTSAAIRGKRVFVGDMTDLFGEWVPWSLLDELFTTFAERPDVTWQVLTKRADRMRLFLSDGQFCPTRWPLPNVWIGVSVENQTAAEERLPHLIDTPADVRFVSVEPLLAGIDLLEGCYAKLPFDARMSTVPNDLRILNWIIVGGESGSKFRDCGVDAILSVTRQCQSAKVPVFVKQDAHRLPGQQGRIPDAYWLKQFPVIDGRA